MIRPGIVSVVLFAAIALLVPVSLLAGRVWFSPAEIVNGSQLASLIDVTSRRRLMAFGAAMLVKGAAA